MHRRTWDAETNTQIVIQGLQGRPVAALCHEHQMSQSLSYQWRDQLLAHASRAFDVPQDHRQETRLVREKVRLNVLGGELTRARKTSDELLG
jgi:transposase-like protein